MKKALEPRSSAREPRTLSLRVRRTGYISNSVFYGFSVFIFQNSSPCGLISATMGQKFYHCNPYGIRVVSFVSLYHLISIFFFKTVKGRKNIIGGVCFSYDLYNLAITDLVDELLYVIWTPDSGVRTYLDGLRVFALFNTLPPSWFRYGDDWRIRAIPNVMLEAQ